MVVTDALWCRNNFACGNVPNKSVEFYPGNVSWGAKHDHLIYITLIQPYKDGDVAGDILKSYQEDLN